MKKIDDVIARESVDAKAIRVYTGKLMKEIDSSIERGENPHIYIQKTYNKKRRTPEIQIVLMGEHHIEDISYPKSDPQTWVSFGEIVFSLEGAEQFIDYFKNVVRTPVKEDLVTIKAREVLITFWKLRTKKVKK